MRPGSLASASAEDWAEAPQGGEEESGCGGGEAESSELWHGFDYRLRGLDVSDRVWGIGCR